MKYKSTLIKNIYYMLAYAFTTLAPSEVESVDAEDFDNIYDLFAAILAQGIGYQLKQGLYREYLNKIETMPSLRGRIDLPGTIRNKIARKLTLTCEYDELSENNLLNQILKTTGLLLMRHDDVKKERTDNLRKVM